MNYRTDNAHWDITALDREGAQSIYGVGERYAAARTPLMRWIHAVM